MRRTSQGVILALLLCGRVWAGESAEGLASWYGEAHRGKTMANGEKFDPEKLTAAAWDYPLGTRVRITREKAGQRASVVATITDRGPARRLVREGRIIDLSRAAFARLADLGDGLVRVRVEVLGPGEET